MTREEMGLQEFKQVEIRSAVMGIKVTITEEMLANAARCTNYGMFELNVKKDSHWMEKVHKTLYEGRPIDQTCDMQNEHRVLHKLILECFLPRDGGRDYRSRHHNLFLHFLIHKYKIDFPRYMFNYLCWSIKESINKKWKQIPYGRLLSEIFHQGGLLKKIRDTGVASDKELGTCTRRVLNGSLLGAM